MSMLRSARLLFVFSVLALVPGLPLSAQTQTEQTLIASMGERLPQLMSLKLSGKAGETNMGLIEARDTLQREERRLVADENRDRMAHYTLIAHRLKVATSAVQQKRAEQIRKSSPAGVWVQSANGDWSRQ
jgi:uncharacterized protein YdbL (DUF1318 family)